MRTKLNVVETVAETTSGEINIGQFVDLLERCGGNLHNMHESCEIDVTEEVLFWIELELAKPENAELQKRWQNALKISAKIRMDLLRCKAFNTLETYENKSASSSAPDISFARTILVGILVEDSESVKFKYRPAIVPGAPGSHPTPESEVMDNLEDQFDKAEE